MTAVLRFHSFGVAHQPPDGDHTYLGVAKCLTPPIAAHGGEKEGRRLSSGARGVVVVVVVVVVAELRGAGVAVSGGTRGRGCGVAESSGDRVAGESVEE